MNCKKQLQELWFGVYPVWYSVKHIMRFQESRQQAWFVKKIFELKHAALLIGESHSLWGGGGRRARGESWKLILYCIFSAAARPLKLYFFAWPPMIPTNAAPILLCSTGWIFGLVSKFHSGDLYKWDSPTAGHLQHFFKTTVTNVQSLELMEPLIPYLPVYNARPVYNTHPDFWPLYYKKKRFQDKHQELKLPFFHLINKSWEFINDMFTTNYKYCTHRALISNTWSPYS